MDQKLLHQREAKCLQDNPPGCSTRCPVHVDARGVVNAILQGDYAAGLALLRQVIPFPGIVSHICDQPCQQGCKRKEIEMPIYLRALEKFCIEQAAPVISVSVMPLKKQKVAVVGAGLSGLTTAFELGRKGYKVEVFEASARLGGKLWDFSEQQLPRQVVEQDFGLLEKLPVEIHLQMPVASLDALNEDFDAIYVAAGIDGKKYNYLGLPLTQDGYVCVEPISLSAGRNKVFAGGSLRRAAGEYSPIGSVADGKIAALSIDRFLQNASLSANREHEGVFDSSLYTNITGIKPQPMVEPADTQTGYNKQEALKEAGRCLRCECLECVKVCEYLRHYGKYPKRYVREVYNNLSIVMGIHRANKMINSCSLCGLCEAVCPGSLDMGEIYHQARKIMVEKGKMPPSTHEFALRDMQFSNSGEFILAKHQPGHAESQFVFYPGCQLSASAPEHVKKMYHYLTEKLSGGVGLMLGCCGAPADWAGQQAAFEKTRALFSDNWCSLGKPQVITACPTCYSLMQRYSPEIPVESLWTMLVRIGLPERKEIAELPPKLAVHDSCTTRYDAELQSSIRNLLEQMGCPYEELPYHHETTECCGYGGLMIYANKEVAHKVIKRRIHETDTDYLAYCSMCRDNFAGQGKRVYHMLDLIFGTENAHRAEQKGPGYSKRQENRRRLKMSLLHEFWGEKVEEVQNEIKVVIPEDVMAVMEDRMILADDVKQVISHAERTGYKMQAENSQNYIAYFRPANVTYWVEYQQAGAAFVVKNAYSHRLNIVAGGEGKK